MPIDSFFNSTQSPLLPEHRAGNPRSQSRDKDKKRESRCRGSCEQGHCIRKQFIGVTSHVLPRTVHIEKTHYGTPNGEHEQKWGTKAEWVFT